MNIFKELRELSEILESPPLKDGVAFFSVREVAPRKAKAISERMEEIEKDIYSRIQRDKAGVGVSVEASSATSHRLNVWCTVLEVLRGEE